MADASWPVLVFGHYFGGSGGSWAKLIEALGTDFTCHAPTLSGFGGVPVKEPSLRRYADEMRQAAGGGNWVAVGHSMSAKIALAAALDADDASGRLRGLVLVAPSPPTPEPMTDEARETMLAAWGDRDKAARHFREIANDRLAPAVFERCVEDQVATSHVAWTWWLEEGSREDISAATRTVVVPTLVITGDDDVVLGPNTARVLSGEMLNSELLVVPNSGHLAPLERPALVADAIRRFVSVRAAA